MDFIIKQTAILGLFAGSFLFMIFGLNLETNLKNMDLYEGKLTHFDLDKGNRSRRSRFRSDHYDITITNGLESKYFRAFGEYNKIKIKEIYRIYTTRENNVKVWVKKIPFIDKYKLYKMSRYENLKEIEIYKFERHKITMNIILDIFISVALFIGAFKISK